MDKRPITVLPQYSNLFSKVAEIRTKELAKYLIIGIFDYIVTYSIPKNLNFQVIKHSPYSQELLDLHQIYSNSHQDNSKLHLISSQLSQKIQSGISSYSSNPKVYNQKVFIKIASLFNVVFSVISQQSLNVYGSASLNSFTLYLASENSKYYLLFPLKYSDSLDLSQYQTISQKTTLHCGDSFTSIKMPAGQKKFYKYQLETCPNCKKLLFYQERQNLYKLLKIDELCFQCGEKFVKKCPACELEFCKNHKNNKCSLCSGNISKKIMSFDDNTEYNHIIFNSEKSKVIPTYSVKANDVHESVAYKSLKDKNYIIFDEELLNRIINLTLKVFIAKLGIVEYFKIKYKNIDDLTEFISLMKRNKDSISRNKTMDNINSFSKLQEIIKVESFYLLFFLNLKLKVFRGTQQFIFGHSEIPDFFLCHFNTSSKKMLINIDELDSELKELIDQPNNKEIKDLEAIHSSSIESNQKKLIYLCCGCKFEYLNNLTELPFIDFNQKIDQLCPTHKKRMNSSEKKLIISFYPSFHKTCCKCFDSYSETIQCEYCSAKFCRSECSTDPQTIFSQKGDKVRCLVCKKFMKHPDLSPTLEIKHLEVSKNPSSFFLYHSSHYSNSAGLICTYCGGMKPLESSRIKCKICQVFLTSTQDICQICILSQKLKI